MPYGVTKRQQTYLNFGKNAMYRHHPFLFHFLTYPDSKVHGAKIGPIRGRQDPGGLHVDPMNLL